MEKKYQVFVSSTYQDLIEERQCVMQALLEMDCIPSGMELFPAADEEQWTLIQRVIDDCDYYIVLVGGRYGSLHPSGKSYTQMEYEYAISKSKPVMGFLHKNPDSLPASKTEMNDLGQKRLKEFRSLVQGRLCKFWLTPGELGAAVTTSMLQLIRMKPARGWVRGEADVRQEKQLKIDDLDLKLEESATLAHKYLEKTLSAFLFDTSRSLPVSSKITKSADGYSIDIKGTEFHIRFGQIESCEATDPHCVVALPANEFFDDECLEDRQSSLGAYIQHAFPGQLDDIRQLICDSVKDWQSQSVEKTAGSFHKSYGIAKCIYLKDPISSKRKLILVSVTRKRAGHRLAAEPRYLFWAVKAINQVMSDHRLHELHFPLLGSGHGGVEKGVALLYTVIAIMDLLHDPSAHELRSVNLILFQPKGSDKSDVPSEIVERILTITPPVFS